MREKEESEKTGLKLNSQKTEIMASGPITSWQIDGEKVEQWQIYSLGSKITADNDCSHEITRCLLLGRKIITNLDSLLKSRDIPFGQRCPVKTMVFPVAMYKCELDHKERWVLKNCTVVLEKTLEGSLNSKIKPVNPKEINPEYSFEGLMLKLKLQYFGHLMRKANSLAETPMLGKTEDKRRGDRGWDSWMASLTQQTWV